MSAVMIQISPFDEFSQIVYIDNGMVVEAHKVAINNVAEFAAKEAIDKQANKILLTGIKAYCNSLKEDLQDKLITEYSNNNIEIEVME